MILNTTRRSTLKKIQIFLKIIYKFIIKKKFLEGRDLRETISRIYYYIHTLITKNKHYSNNIVINIILCNNRIVYQL